MLHGCVDIAGLIFDVVQKGLIAHIIELIVDTAAQEHRIVSDEGSEHVIVWWMRSTQI